MCMYKMHIWHTSFYVTQFMGYVVSVDSHYKLNTTTCCSLYCAAAILQLCHQLSHNRCMLASLEGSFQSAPNINRHYRTYYGTAELFKSRRVSTVMFHTFGCLRLNDTLLHYTYTWYVQRLVKFFMEIWCLPIDTT